jgi:hypothetical protein
MIEVINFSSTYDDFKEIPDRKWIKWDTDNLYPQRLIELTNNSSMHNSILSSKVDMICGNGLSYEGETDILTEQFLKKANRLGETLDDILYKVSYDQAVFGGFALEIILTRDRNNIAEIRHLDMSKIRATEKVGNVVQGYWYSNNFGDTRKKINYPSYYPVYSESSTEANQILFVKQYRPGIDYYPKPSYNGAIRYIKIDGEISTYHLNHLQNGMAPQFVISFTDGEPTTEERAMIKKSIKETLTGAKGEKFILTFSKSKDNAPVITPISMNGLSSQFTQLQQDVLQNILSGHKVTSPLLVGLRSTGGGFGSNADELQNAFQIFNSQVITPMKELVLKNFNMIMKRKELKDLFIITNSPVSFSYSENILKEIMTVNEMREEIGLEPLTKNTENNE